MLSGTGCKIALLSHQGKVGAAEHLDFVIPYLKSKLHTDVRYFESTDKAEIVKEAKAIKEGEIVLFANTRKFAGETENTADLARFFASLGEKAVIGGFSKLHRQHASNYGLAEQLPAVLASGVVKELSLLKTWSGVETGPQSLSIAILGGVKKEKLDPGLLGFVKIYDYVIPAGAVLNRLLQVQGASIANSVLPGDSTSNAQGIEALLRLHGNKVLLPEAVVVLNQYDRTEVRSAQGLVLTEGEQIVDFLPTQAMQQQLSRVRDVGGRLLLAGTPTCYTAGHKTASDFFLSIMQSPKVRSILLGGDSCADLPFTGHKSAGGGAALCYLIQEQLPILRKFEISKRSA